MGKDWGSRDEFSIFHPGDLLCLCCPPCDCEAVVECGRLASPSWSSSREREMSMFWLLCSWPCTVALLLLQEEKQKTHLHLSTGPEWMSASKSTCIAQFYLYIHSHMFAMFGDASQK